MAQPAAGRTSARSDNFAARMLAVADHLEHVVARFPAVLAAVLAELAVIPNLAFEIGRAHV